MTKIQIINQNGINFLWNKNKLITWDIPAEQSMLKEMSKIAFGNVLVVGYGLGLVQQYLLENPKVNSVTTLEKNKDIPQINHETFKQTHGEILIGNFFTHKIEQEYDCIMTDVCKEIMLDSLSNYRRFKKRAQELLRPKGKIIAWGKNYFEYLIDSKKILRDYSGDNQGFEEIQDNSMEWQE